MAVTKSMIIFASRLIAIALSSLMFIHQLKRIDAFQLYPIQGNRYSSKTKNICCKVHPSNQMRRKHLDVLLATDQDDEPVSVIDNRRRFLAKSASILLSSSASWMMTMAQPVIANAAGELPDQFNVDDYLKSGMVMNPMGVSGQAGKSKPVTGIVLREGSEVSRDGRTGDVLAEILIQGTSATTVPVLASFAAPWPLASGTVFDVECRNPTTGDGAFLAVSSQVKSNALQDIPDSFFVEQLIGPKGRFSSYGTPTDVKVRSSSTNGNYRAIDVSFSTLSQSTQTELPRRARIMVTIPDGTRQAVMLVGSASLSRWNKSSKDTILAVTDSFRAIPAPTSSLRLRAKERRS